ncbi:MAG TPA: glycosyltransferase family 4 protein [Phycisphaerae bacterium]|nr:glycosyltransferase family 4 protein [Phycisphaerae bacterium]HQE27840.1 glycosyltransferase family 4 protein [Phycisphaerae bacterium]
MRRDISKLLFVSDAPHFGGAEQYVANMVAAARIRGISSVVWWARPCTGTEDVFAEARRQGADVWVVPPARTRHLHALCRELRRCVRQERPDAMIVNACGRPRFWAVPWVCRLEGVPSLWVHHMVDHLDYRRLMPARLGGRIEGLNAWRWPQALRHRLAATASTAVVTLNEEDRAQVAREHCIRPHHVHVVRNGIDTSRYRFDSHARTCVRAVWREAGILHDLPTEPFIVGSAGRLVHGKGFELLAQAIAVLRGRGMDVQAVVAGDGPDRQKLISIAGKLGVADYFALLGQVADMPAFYSAIDAFALCSSTESFGLVLGEAMSCERAVVATPTAGARMQIDDGLTGLLLESFSTEELADKLSALASQSLLREQLGCNARRRVMRELSIETALDRTLSLLRRPQTAANCHQPLALPVSRRLEEAA